MTTGARQAELGLEPSAAKVWDLNLARRSLDELFALTQQYKSSAAYIDLLHFIARFRSYSPFNAMLIHTQMRGARYVAPPHRWWRDYRRHIRPGARPLVILQPKGPVMFVFDVGDTEAADGAPPLPPQVLSPFEVRSGTIGGELDRAIRNAKRDGVRVTEQDTGTTLGGMIGQTQLRGFLNFEFTSNGAPKVRHVPHLFDLVLNSRHSVTVKYRVLVHELGHLYCGHQGTPNPRWWPDRRGLSLNQREFEAESVSFLVCARLGIDNPSEAYLFGYMQKNREIPPISFDSVMKASALIEQMGRETMKPRKTGEL